MSEVLMVATPLATGISLVTPKEFSPKVSLLLAALGAGAGIFGLLLAREGRIEEAVIADMASIMFDLFSILNALELL